MGFWARVLARLAGQCVSMFRAFGPGKLMLRNVYRTLGAQHSWQDTLVLDNAARRDLEWRKYAIKCDNWNGQILCSKPPEVQIIN